MRWFKHDAAANSDPKLEKVMMKYGAEGYALYWLCLELIAAPIDRHNLSFELEHDAEILGYRLKIDSARVEEIMRYFVQLGLFECEPTTQRITCLKLAARLENSVIKNPQLKHIQQKIKEGSNPGSSRTIPDHPGSSGTIPDNPGKSRLDIDIDIEKDKTPSCPGSGDPGRRKPKWTDADRGVAETMLRLVRQVAPSQKGSKTWPDTIRLMRERDGRTHEEILDMFRWANDDEFWRANILSPEKLRKKWPQLEAKRGQSEQRGQSDAKNRGVSAVEQVRKARERSQGRTIDDQ